MPRGKKGKNSNGKEKNGKNKRKATSPLLKENDKLGGNPCAASEQVNKRKTLHNTNLYASPLCTMFPSNTNSMNGMNNMNGMTSPMNVNNMATPPNFQQPNFQQPYSGYGYPQTPQMSQTLPPPPPAPSTPPHWAAKMMDDIDIIKTSLPKIEQIEKTVNSTNHKVCKIETKLQQLESKVNEVEAACNFLSNESDQHKKEIDSTKTEIKKNEISMY